MWEQCRFCQTNCHIDGEWNFKEFESGFNFFLAFISINSVCHSFSIEFANAKIEKTEEKKKYFSESEGKLIFFSKRLDWPAALENGERRKKRVVNFNINCYFDQTNCMLSDCFS